MAVRADLLRTENMDADEATREGLESASGSEKAALLTQLTSLRLLDALAWAIASNGLPAGADSRA